MKGDSHICETFWAVDMMPSNTAFIVVPRGLTLSAHQIAVAVYEGLSFGSDSPSSRLQVPGDCQSSQTLRFPINARFATNHVQKP